MESSEKSTVRTRCSENQREDVENMKKQRGLGRFFIHPALLFFAITCIIPFLAVVSISLSDEFEIAKKGYSLIPRNLSLLAYKFILKNPIKITRSYVVTASVCIIGTFFSLFVMSLCAYPLSRRDFKYRNIVSFIVFFTMLFNGGLVPTFIWVSKYLKLGDTFWVLFLPAVVSPWYLLLLRTFFQTIPYEIIESATIDGASELQIYLRLILPLSKPALATVGLFTMLGFWNDWFRGLLYIDNSNLVTLQYMLYRMMGNIDELRNAMTVGLVGIDLASLPNESARMAMCVLAAGPMILILPFFQKYFIKGLTVGSIK